jgi:hypothetical protein
MLMDAPPHKGQRPVECSTFVLQQKKKKKKKKKTESESFLSPAFLLTHKGPVL